MLASQYFRGSSFTFPSLPDGHCLEGSVDSATPRSMVDCRSFVGRASGVGIGLPASEAYTQGELLVASCSPPVLPFASLLGTLS